MRVFLMGATGAIGAPLVDALRAAGHDVTATTRSAERAAALGDRGVTAILLDAFDAGAVHAAVAAARPEAVIHQLTALPQTARARDWRAGLEQTARLRRETVPTLLDAAATAGATRALVQSVAFATRPDGRAVHDESAPLELPRWQSIAALEEAVANAPVTGLVLRYGHLYGPGTGFAPDSAPVELIGQRRFPLIGTGAGRTSWLHVDDAVAATVAALTRGDAGVYNVTGEAAAARDWLPELARLMGAPPPRRIPAWPLRRLLPAELLAQQTTLPAAANERARAAFGWAPRPWREGFGATFAEASDRSRER